MDDVKLLILDVDGTIADRDSTELYSGAVAYLSLLKNARNAPKIAIATNQGGAACHDAGWSFSRNFPSLAQIEDRLSTICDQIEELAGQRPYLLMALAYRQKNGVYIYPANVDIDDPRLRHDWRKPEAGMLIEAMNHFGVSPSFTLMIGDSEADQGAAESAGCHFQWAQKFFLGGAS